MQALSGVVPATTSVEAGRIVVTSSTVYLGGAAPYAFLVMSLIVTVVICAMFSHAIAARRRDLQREVEMQAWHLRKLLPG